MRREFLIFPFLFSLILFHTTFFLNLYVVFFFLFVSLFFLSKISAFFLSLFIGIMLDIFSEKIFYFYTFFTILIFIIVQFFLKRYVKIL